MGCNFTRGGQSSVIGCLGREHSRQREEQGPGPEAAVGPAHSGNEGAATVAGGGASGERLGAESRMWTSHPLDSAFTLLTGSLCGLWAEEGQDLVYVFKASSQLLC